MAKGKNKRPQSELKMNDETKPELQEAAGAADAGVGQSNAPVSESTGIADQSAAASDAVAPGTTTAEPEPAGAGAEEPVAASAAELIAAAPVPAPAPTPPPVVVMAAPAPVLKVAPVVEEKPSNAVAGSTPYDNVNRQLEKVPKGKHAIIHFLIEYARDMAPRRPIPVTTGSNYQVNLYRQLHALINKEDEHFRPLFTAVLQVFEHEASRCFAASHAFRFMDTVTLNKDERMSFMSLIDMLRLLGPAEGRKEAGKQISLSKVLAKNMTDTGRARVLSYFDGTI